MKLIANWIIQALVLLITAYIIPGFRIDSFTSALVVALVLGILNALVKPLLIFFTLPATILTLGLFLFVINAVLLLIAARIVNGFHIDSFFSSILAAIVISIVSHLLNSLIK